jgi:hypothetical protein
MQIEVPLPSVLSTMTEPLSFSTAVRTTSMPTPRPERSVTTVAVDRPAAKIRLTASRSSDTLESRFVDQPFLISLALDYRRINALAVVDDLDDHAVSFLRGADRERTGLRLAALARLTSGDSKP